jgi:hypothetical protein
MVERRPERMSQNHIVTTLKSQEGTYYYSWVLFPHASVVGNISYNRKGFSLFLKNHTI